MQSFVEAAHRQRLVESMVMWQPIDEMPKHIDKTPPVIEEIITHPRSYPRGHQLGTHVHAQAQLLFSATGIMNVTTPTGIFLVPPQRAVWIPPRVEHSVDALTDIEMRSIYLESSWLKRHPNYPQLDQVYVIKVNALLRELILATYRKEASEEQIDLLMKLALFELAEAKDATTSLPMPTDARAKKVAQLALADIEAKKGFEQLCDEANASNRTITRLFTKETKLSFREWRQRARIMNAVELLGENNRSIKQIALKLGFSSTSAFSHAFKEVMGVTPQSLSNLE
jgi:AraC-like DNA-binding protein